MTAARVFTPAEDGSCMVCGLYELAHSHAPACPVTTDSLEFGQILYAVTSGAVSYSTGWDAQDVPGPARTAARQAIVDALNRK